MKRLPTIKSLEKKAKKLWHECIRLRDGGCIVCGKKTNTCGHHFVVLWSRGKNVRFSLHNGVCLCVKCHLWGYHGRQWNKDQHELFSRRANETVPVLMQEYVKRISKDTMPPIREFLMNKIEYLSEYIKEKGGNDGNEKQK